MSIHRCGWRGRHRRRRFRGTLLGHLRWTWVLRLRRLRRGWLRWIGLPHGNYGFARGRIAHHDEGCVLLSSGFAIGSFILHVVHDHGVWSRQTHRSLHLVRHHGWTSVHHLTVRHARVNGLCRHVRRRVIHRRVRIAKLRRVRRRPAANCSGMEFGWKAHPWAAPSSSVARQNLNQRSD